LRGGIPNKTGVIHLKSNISPPNILVPTKFLGCQRYCYLLIFCYSTRAHTTAVERLTFCAVSLEVFPKDYI